MRRRLIHTLCIPGVGPDGDCKTKAECASELVCVPESKTPGSKGKCTESLWYLYKFTNGNNCVDIGNASRVDDSYTLSAYLEQALAEPVVQKLSAAANLSVLTRRVRRADAPSSKWK